MFRTLEEGRIIICSSCVCTLKPTFEASRVINSAAVLRVDVVGCTVC